MYGLSKFWMVDWCTLSAHTSLANTRDYTSHHSSPTLYDECGVNHLKGKQDWYIAKTHNCHLWYTAGGFLSNISISISA